MATPHYILNTDPNNPYPAIGSTQTYNPKYDTFLDRINTGLGNHAAPQPGADGVYDPDDLPHGALAAYPTDTFSADRRFRYTGGVIDPGVSGGAEK